MKHIIKNKKGIMVSVITLVFVSVIFSLSIDFKERSNFMNRNSLDMFSSKKIKFIERNIADNFLEIIGLEIEQLNQYHSGNTDYLDIKFSIPKLSDTRADPNIQLNTYQNFINNQFKLKSNADLSLLVNSPSIFLSPFNITIAMGSSDMSIQLPSTNPDLLNLSLQIFLDKQISFLNQSLESLSLGSNHFSLIVYDNDSNILYQVSDLLDFNSLSLINLRFNDTTPNSNFTLRIDNNHIKLNLTSGIESYNNNLFFSFNHTSNNKIYIRGDANNYISTKSGQINKTGNLVLLES